MRLAVLWILLLAFLEERNNICFLPHLRNSHLALTLERCLREVLNGGGQLPLHSRLHPVQIEIVYVHSI